MEVLIFDVWGGYGFFRKIFTTSSPLTYAFPPRTTVIGMIASILGKDRDSYYEEFNNEKCKIAVRLINPVSKMKFNTNLLETRSLQNNFHTQVGFEILKNPHYRIFFYHEDKNIMESLEMFLRNHKTVYNISLGIANCLANFAFNNKSQIKPKNLNEIDSVLDMGNLKKILEYGQYFKTKMPVDFNSDRIATSYKEYLFECNGKMIRAECQGFIVTETGEKIVFM